MAHASEHYLAVLKASYDYEPQSEDEIAIKEDQLLLLLEKVDDDWWKVKLKGSSQEGDGETGLIPAAYVEQAEHTSVVKAIYDYEAAAPGELNIQEDDVLLVFDTEEDWILVQDEKDGKVGYVPGNYVEVNDAPKAPQIVIPDSPPRPTSTYVDPADRVRSNKVTADDIQTWSLSEIDKKGKKKKGTLGIGNGAIFFASEADKTPVQRWQTKDVISVSSEKAKHVQIEIGGPSPIALHFHTGSKENADAIISKLQSSKSLSTPSEEGEEAPPPVPRSVPPASEAEHRDMKRPSVHFSQEPDIIPPASPEEEEEEEVEVEELHSVDDQPHTSAVTAVALYDFSADGEDELSAKEGEVLTILEKDGDEWWKCRNSKGLEGVVPASYLEESGATTHDQDPEEDDSGAHAAAAAAAREAQDRTAQLAAQEVKRKREEEEKEQQRKLAEARKLDAQKKAREAAAAADAERRRRKEAAAAAAAATQANNSARDPPKSPSPNRPSSSSSRPSGELSLPSPEKVRTWHDRSGQFRVDAEFLGFNNGKLRLHKVNGVIVEVPSEKMSVEDMRYVEKWVNKRSRPPTASRVSDDDIPLAITRAASTPKQPPPPKKAPKIDWFDFFLSAGCDLDDCTRYSAAFERDKIDETILGDITGATMRSLGLREGDIIRVKKAIEQRKPQDNLAKPSPYTQQQIKEDEELARQLQQQEGGKTAPNLFAGPGGVLKQRRGRPQPSRSLPLATVDITAISSASDQILRTTSPKSSPLIPQTSTPVSAPARPPSAPIQSGFEDDAWTNRPSSAKPKTTPSPAPAAVAASAPSPKPTPPVSAALQSAPATNGTTSAPPSAPPTLNTTPILAKTESDIFDQLARLSELRKSTTPIQPQAPSPAFAPVAAAPSPGFQAGMGMGPSPVPMGQLSPSPSQMYNGPRGPYAPVPANTTLLQPLIPTQTGFSGFIPTTQQRPAPPPPPQRQMLHQTQLSPPPFFSSAPNFMSSQPMLPQQTGMFSQQGMMPQQTGMMPPQNGMMSQQSGLMPQQTGMYGNFNSSAVSPFHSAGSPFTPMQSQMTGFNPPMNNSLFNNPPPLPNNPNNNNTSPANVFAQMKSGTFAMDS